MAFSEFLTNQRCGCDCHYHMEEEHRPKAVRSVQHANRNSPVAQIDKFTSLCQSCFDESNIADGEHFLAYVLEEAS